MNFLNKKLTIQDLMNIDEGRISRSKGLKISLTKIFKVVKEENLFQKILRFIKGKEKLMFYQIFKYKVESDSGSRYTVFIKVSPSFDSIKFLKNTVQIFCSCADFKYRAAYSLNKSGSLYLNKATKKSLGVALTTAPTRIDTTPICKHSYATLIYFRNHLSSYGLIKKR